MLVIITTAFIIITTATAIVNSTNHKDSFRNEYDSDFQKKLLQRMDQMQSQMNQMENKWDANIKNLSHVMETIVEQQMVITAEVFTVSQTLPFCCCQYQSTTGPVTPPKTTTPKPVKSLPTNCADAMGESGLDGVYRINVTNSNIGPFDVYCMKKVAKTLEEDIINGTWLIIQRRQDNIINFIQGWSLYQHGFGDLKGNFWIGLDKINALTESTNQELWVQLKDKDGKEAWAKYSDFAIGSEYEKYELKTLGRYVGTAGDSLTHHKGQFWSTFDSDNDSTTSRNCAMAYKGAWWYRDCHESNLNGQYDNNSEGEGINWKAWHGWQYSLKYAHMAIRPRQ